MATDRDRLVAIARTWIGTPYVHQASLKGKGCDCIGLLRGVWREYTGCRTDPEILPPYAPDWAEATGAETLRDGLARHLRAIGLDAVAPGDAVLFRMIAAGPAKHCGIVASRGSGLTLIHSRMNKQVSEEPFSAVWRRTLAYAFAVL